MVCAIELNMNKEKILVMAAYLLLLRGIVDAVKFKFFIGFMILKAHLYLWGVFLK